MSALLNKLRDKNFWKSNVFIFLGSITLLLAIFQKLASKSNDEIELLNKYSIEVKNKLAFEIQQTEKELESTLSLIKESNNVNFSYLTTKNKYPYYIFKNKRIIYWSDYFFVPDYQKCSNDFTIKYTEFVQGKYLLLKRKYKKASGEYEIITTIPLWRMYEENNLNLKNVFNPFIFSKEPQAIFATKQKKLNQNYYDSKNGEFLFSAIHPKNLIDRNQSSNLILLFMFSAFSFLIHFRKTLLGFSKTFHKEFVFLIIILSLFIFRFTLLYFNVLSEMYDNELFSSQNNSNSFWQPTVADAILNICFYCVPMIYFANNYFRMESTRIILSKSKKKRHLISVILVMLSYAVILCIASIYDSIYKLSGNLLHPELSIDFIKNPLRIYNLLIFALLSLFYFLCLHFLVYFHLKLNRDVKKPWKSFLVASIITCFFLVFLGKLSALLCLINTSYFLLMWYFKLPRFYHSFRYQTSIYFFSGAFYCALFTSLISHDHEKNKDFTKKHNVGKKYLTENDEIIESKLNQINLKIKSDSALSKIINSNFLSQERSLQHLNEKYFDAYFDNYTIELSLYDAFGISNEGGEDRTFFKTIEKTYINTSLKTSYENLYFITNFNNGAIEKQYIDILPLTNARKKNYGHIVLMLKPLDNTLSSHLKSENFEINKQEIPGFSYAIYKNKKIEISNGEYNYSNKLLSESLEDSALFQKGIVKNGYKHIGIMGKYNRTLVVSSKEKKLTDHYANFSFLLVILILCIIILVLFYAIGFGFKSINTNFATKIQVFLNLAFLLPLILVISTTIAFVANKLSLSQNQLHYDQTKAISSSISPELNSYTEGKMSLSFLEEKIKSIAIDSRKDIVIYGIDGKKLVSNKSLHFQQGIYSDFINPKAYQSIIEEKEIKMNIPESLANLGFNTSYLGLSNSKNQLIGTLGVMYYNSQKDYEKEVEDVMSSLLNTFTTVFVILLILSYFASRILIVPLQMISSKIDKIDLEKTNTPINWHSDDEIGVLVNAYNTMLVKLEESKLALFQSNMQTAWQEMAKQVAHEIKNPLTPMKLSLQLLLRKLSANKNEHFPQIDKQFNSIIEQIDNLSYIANSFSDFAKMPVPINEKYDLGEELNKILLLYEGDSRFELKTDIHTERILVRGDKHLTGNVISNLLINAIQSVAKGTVPQISIQLKKGVECMIFSITDNGIGIPESIHNKIFMLNFSTKQGGSGVGLSLAKRVIDHANGSIWFDTETGKGTTFYFSVPLA